MIRYYTIRGDDPQIIVKDDEVSLLSNTDQATTKTKLSGSTNLSSSFPGILYIKLIRANVMNKNFPPETDMNDVLKSHSSMSSANDSFHLKKNPSDYIRISWTGSGEKSVRTETIYHTSNPRFDGKEMEFEVSHYGMEFKLELIDANSDEAVGIALITAQGVLQEQRDRLLNNPDFSVWSLFDPKKFSGAGKRRTNLA